MPAELSDVARDASMFLGIPLALVAAVLLSLGAQYQHRGVATVERNTGSSARGGLDLRHLLALASRPSWLVGTALLGVAIVLQLTSLTLAPLTLVQPLGVVALVVTAVYNARVSKSRLNAGSVRAIALCVGGVALFVTLAGLTAVDPRVTDASIITVLIVLGVVLVLAAVAFAALRRRFGAIFYVVAAGVLYGFVATLAKLLLSRLAAGEFDVLLLFGGMGLLLAAVLGGYFVQTAYASGPPDLVIAGLTVVDPLVAVAIGVLVLGEAAAATPLAMVGYVVTGAIATFGVFQLAKHHPQIRA